MPIPVSQTSMRSLSPRRRQPSRTFPYWYISTAFDKQIADHLLEQPRIAAHAEAARDHAPAEAMRRRVIGELGPQLLEHGIDREIDHLAADDPGLELVDVEKRVQHARHRAHGLVEPADQPQGLFVLDLLRQ